MEGWVGWGGGETRELRQRLRLISLTRCVSLSRVFRLSTRSLHFTRALTGPSTHRGNTSFPAILIKLALYMYYATSGTCQEICHDARHRHRNEQNEIRLSSMIYLIHHVSCHHTSMCVQQHRSLRNETKETNQQQNRATTRRTNQTKKKGTELNHESRNKRKMNRSRYSHAV